MFDFLYTSHEDPIACLGKRYRPPAVFRRGEWELVARVAKPRGGDGYPVEVYECRLPARFYKVKALPTTNSMKRPKKGFVLSTGSSKGELAGQIALAIAEGMLALEKEKP